MSTRRGDDLVCPIARALDRVGDRWTLLILRDLHAGPARFSDLETGLGIASNLLSGRLRDLTDDALVARAGDIWPELRARLIVEDESFTIRSSPSSVTVHYNDVDSPTDIVLSTSYDAIMAASDGEITLDQFLDQREIVEGRESAPPFFELYRTGAIAQWGVDPSG